MWSRIVLLLVASVFCVTPAYSAISKDLQRKILREHNKLRRTLPATNMQKMFWDKELASNAMKWARQCNHLEVDPNPWHERYNQRFGQNVGYRTGDDVKPSIWINMQSLINYWWKDKRSIFVQMAIAETSVVGCGYADCSSIDEEKIVFVCAYLPQYKQKHIRAPYIKGTPGSACGKRFFKNGLCDCGKKYCANDGKLNLKTCQCKCIGFKYGSSTWYGPECTKFCGKKCENNGKLNRKTCQCKCSGGWSGPKCTER